MTAGGRFFERAPMAGAVFDADGRLVDVNAEFSRLLGYEKSELVGARLNDLTHPCDRAADETGMRLLEKGEILKYRAEKRYACKDGKIRRVVQSVGRLDGNHENEVRFFALMDETSDADSAEKKLSESESRYEMLFNNAGDAIYIHDASGKILEANRIACEQTGYEKEELLKMTFQEIHTWENVSPSNELIPNYPRWGKDLHLTNQIARDGSIRPVEASNRGIVFEGEPAFMTIARDVSYRTRLEAQLLQSQKMEAVGRLAGGIAHDFNNLMTAVISFTGFLLMETDENDSRRADLKEIEKAGKRAAELTRQLLAFSRKQVMNVDIIDLNELVRRNQKMLRKLMGERVAVWLNLTGDLWRVKADPAQMELVLFNLAVNAKDAMPRGGRLGVTTENIVVEKNRGPGNFVAEPGQYVRWSILDTGCGMDTETRSRIFEPFFTTKLTGKGTGLGLSTAYGIIAQSSGAIYVKSEPGHGTVFHIYLPRANGTASRRKVRQKNVSDFIGNETILIVEDERGLRSLASKVLSKYGYTPLIARNGEEALKICGGRAEKIDVMLTDVVMPGLTGQKLVDKVRALKPDIKILFMSGYPSDEILNYNLVGWEKHFLSKPFSTTKLLSKVRQLLDE